MVEIKQEFKADKWHQVIQERTLMKYVEKLKEQNWEYLDGYTCRTSPIRIRCMKCGEIRTVKGDYIGRKPKEGRYKKINCWTCNKQATEEKYNERRKEKQKKLAIKKLVRRLEKVAKQKQPSKPKEPNQYFIRRCKECGELFDTTIGNQMFCSKKCASRYNNRTHWYKRKGILSKADADKSITLVKLYKRDNGVCYLCGGVCDWNDCRYEGETFIAGNNYPSVEHVVPLSKGGKHVWSNVRLAHRLCNTLKRDGVYLPTDFES